MFDGKSDEDAWAQFVTLIFGHLSSEDCAYLIHSTEFLQEYCQHGQDAIKEATLKLQKIPLLVVVVKKERTVQEEI